MPFEKCLHSRRCHFLPDSFLHINVTLAILDSPDTNRYEGGDTLQRSAADPLDEGDDAITVSMINATVRTFIGIVTWVNNSKCVLHIPTWMYRRRRLREASAVSWGQGSTLAQAQALAI